MGKCVALHLCCLDNIDTNVLHWFRLSSDWFIWIRSKRFHFRLHNYSGDSAELFPLPEIIQVAFQDARNRMTHRHAPRHPVPGGETPAGQMGNLIAPPLLHSTQVVPAPYFLIKYQRSRPTHNELVYMPLPSLSLNKGIRPCV